MTNMVSWIFGITLLITIVTAENNGTYYKSYKCVNRKCARAVRPVTRVPSGQGFSITAIEHSTMAACRLSCDPFGALWPVPTGDINLGYEYTPIHNSEFNFNTNSVPDGVLSFVKKMKNNFLKDLRRFGGQNDSTTQNTVTVILTIGSSDLTLDWSTNESYSLNMVFRDKGNRGEVQIVAETVYGARHGLETLLQLTAPVILEGGRKGLVILRSAFITDAPIFAHRGLTIDTARNFIPVSEILKTIDGLSSCKMNVLHWHATDSQSFPLQIERVPMMTLYGAYDSAEIYSTRDMKNIVAYGKERGVRVILELDMPAHMGSGWEWGEEAGLGSLAVCVNAQPWKKYCIEPPCGQLNPVNQQLYVVLRDIFKDLIEIWGSDATFHMGGDEVFIPCWNSSTEITESMRLRGLGRNTSDFLQLWSEFQNTVLDVVDRERGEIRAQNLSTILWSSFLTNPDTIELYLDPNRYIIHTWVPSSSPLPEQLLSLGYRLIISTKSAWYLDHGVWGTTTYHTWRDVYTNRILREDGVLGGEVASWGEYLDGESIDPRLWPRTAAAAERLWSDPIEIPLVSAELRLQNHRDRLRVRGIRSEAIAPKWCAQHDGQCYYS